MSAVLLVLLLLPLVGAAVVGAMARREDLDRAAKIRRPRRSRWSRWCS